MSLNDVLNKLKESYSTLPLFNRSFFELKNNIIGDSINPTRAYLNIGRELFYYLNQYFSVRRDFVQAELRLNDLKEKANTPEKYSEKERTLIQADLDVAIIIKTEAELQFNELIQVVSYLYNEFIKYPQFNRQEIEQGEVEYHTKMAIKDGDTREIEKILYETDSINKKLIDVVKSKLEL
jgi:hypothetical protein